ncbi:MAG: phosphatidic acid phosphatase [Aureispira sp.]|nr:phosphatidic acid phosphatase [Aureispira sp.]
MDSKEIEQMNRHIASFSPVVRWGAQLVSVVFHPLLILAYAFILLAKVNPFLFGCSSFTKVMDSTNNQIMFIHLMLFTFAIPTLAVLIMRGLNLVQTFTLRDRMDRIGPYILTGIFYMVEFMNLNYSTIMPLEVKIFMLGATIALFLAFFVNLFSKISMHTVGMGGFLAMVLISIVSTNDNNGHLLLWAIVACGLVGTSRLILSAHETSDIYGGYFIGFLAQFVALRFLFIG